MKRKISRQTKDKRTIRRLRIRARVSGDPERPRLSVYRSSRQLRVQIIDDIASVTLFSASTLSNKKKETKMAQARNLGLAVAKGALEKGIRKVVFDRSGYLYHGRVKALADGARAGGLDF